jgi:5-methylcytosine-specific restriction protein A
MAKTLTTAEWIDVWHDDKIMRPLGRDILKALYAFPHHKASAKQLGEALKKPWQTFNLEMGHLIGRKIAEHYDLELTQRENREYKFWDIFFEGEEDGELFDWILRPELAEALVAVGAVEKKNNYFLYTWKPSKFAWDIAFAKEQIQRQGFYETIWGTKRTNLSIGDHFFLIKLEKNKGIMASGIISGLPYPAPERNTGYNVVPLRFDAIQDVDEDYITLEELQSLGDTNWTTQSEGIIIDPKTAEKIELRWNQIINRSYSEDFSLPGLPAVISGIEGGRRTITVTAVERNPANRAACLAHWGDSCVACGFNFGKEYGSKAEGYIHVHHHNLLAESGEILTDPIHDMSPLCPNCHAVAHLNRPPYSIDELKAMQKNPR